MMTKQKQPTKHAPLLHLTDLTKKEKRLLEQQILELLEQADLYPCAMEALLVHIAIDVGDKWRSLVAHNVPCDCPRIKVIPN